MILGGVKVGRDFTGMLPQRSASVPKDGKEELADCLQIGWRYVRMQGKVSGLIERPRVSPVHDKDVRGSCKFR